MSFRGHRFFDCVIDNTICVFSITQFYVFSITQFYVFSMAQFYVFSMAHPTTTLAQKRHSTFKCRRWVSLKVAAICSDCRNVSRIRLGFLSGWVLLCNHFFYWDSFLRQLVDAFYDICVLIANHFHLSWTISVYPLTSFGAVHGIGAGVCK